MVKLLFSVVTIYTILIAGQAWQDRTQKSTRFEIKTQIVTF